MSRHNIKTLVVIAALLTAISAKATTFPLIFEPNGLGGGQIFLPCTYNGFLSRCFFDSGSNQNNVAFNDVTRQLPVIRQVTFWGAGGQRKTCDVIRLNSWTIGYFTQSNVEAVRCPDSVPSDTIGIGYFSEHRFALNIGYHRFEVDSPIPQNVVREPLKIYSSGHIAVSVQVSGRQFEAMWDTGAGVSVVDRRLVSEMPQVFSFIQDIPTGHDGTGAQVFAKLYNMTNLTIGGVSFPESKVLAIDFSAFAQNFSPNMRLVLGPSHMQFHDWFIDIPSQKWAISP